MPGIQQTWVTVRCRSPRAALTRRAIQELPLAWQWFLITIRRSCRFLIHGISGRAGHCRSSQNVTPLKSIRIVVHDPMQRYADRVLYSDLPAPDTVTWDRVIGPASAPPGSYTVTVEVCDIYGLCSKDTGTILIPIAPTPVPSQQPVVEIPRWISTRSIFANAGACT